MSAMWIRVNARLTDSVTVRQFARELLPTFEPWEAVPFVVGMLVALWGTMIDAQEDGYVGDRDDDVLEKWAGWRGEPGRFAKLFRTLFVQEDGRVHAWEEYQGPLIARREKDRERKRLHHNAPAYPRDRHAEQQTTPRGTRAEGHAEVRASNRLPTHPLPYGVHAEGHAEIPRNPSPHGSHAETIETPHALHAESVIPHEGHAEGHAEFHRSSSRNGNGNGEELSAYTAERVLPSAPARAREEVAPLGAGRASATAPATASAPVSPGSPAGYLGSPSVRDELLRRGVRPEQLAAVREPPVPFLEAEHERITDDVDYTTWLNAEAGAWLAAHPDEAAALEATERAAMGFPANGDLKPIRAHMLHAQVVEAVRRLQSWPTRSAWHSEGAP